MRAPAERCVSGLVNAKEGVRRLLSELGRRHTAAQVDAAIASLVVTVDGAIACVTRERGAPLFGLAPPRASVARIEPHVYTETPTEGARVRLLVAAAAIAPRVEVHAPAVSEGTYRGRLAIDLPRRGARALGLPVAEPGDRFADHFVHAFFDEEPILEEAARAGLAFVARRGAWVVLERSVARSIEVAAPFGVEIARAIALAREAERLRLANAPERAVHAMRERGRRGNARGPIGRARLCRAIGWVDAAFPGGPNCLRRTLVEIGLDANAAEETLVFGLDVGRTGHVAFKDREDRGFDVAFEIPPDAPPLERSRLRQER